MEFLLLFLLFAVVILLLVMVYVMRGNALGQGRREALRGYDADMQERMNQQLYQLQLQMQDMMRKELTAFHETIEQRMYSMERNVSTTMHQGYQNTNDAFHQVLERMGRLDESQHNLKEISAGIMQLQQVLQDKKTRGIFGEIELYSLLEMAMGEDMHRYGKQVHLGNGSIADAVVYASEPLKAICIDSKFPLENYNRIQSATTPEETRRYKAAFVQDVKKHIKTIAAKYIIPEETAEFAYMFIPAEAVFSYIYANMDEVVRYSYEQKVYMVSPTTLMAYLTAIKAIYLGVKRNEHMGQMQEELKLLAQEFERFDKRYQSVANDFERCYQDMHQLEITAGKLVKRFTQIQEVKLDAAEKEETDGS